MEGTQQSGDPFNLKIANLVHDGQVLQLARDITTEVINEDPELNFPSNQTLKKQLEKLFQKKDN